MTSLWKDLLFLHGHLVHKEDLDWRADIQANQASQSPRKDDKTKRAIVACCAHVWPRIVGPR
ncbi:hypothetical protein ACPPVV_18015 [Rhodanobacter sp. Col0626]|uniref:hypothetical protein n=1 Tax=Rhodanobacter sp. Col0626 TaxID=3415679 RepID=UPI003CEC14B9